VRQILYGVSGILRSKGKTQIDLVPLEDRVYLLKMASVPSTITIGSWVRIKRKCRYKGDLALVRDVRDQYISAAVVPRIPMDRKRDRQGRTKPALFDAEAVNAAYGAGAAMQRNQVWVFKRDTYVNGLLELEFGTIFISWFIYLELDNSEDKNVPAK